MKKIYLLLCLSVCVTVLTAQTPANNVASNKIATSDGTPSSGNKATDDPNANTYFAAASATTLNVVLDLGATYYIENMASYDILVKIYGVNVITIYGSPDTNGADNFNTVIASKGTNNTSVQQYGFEVNKWFKKIKVTMTPYMGGSIPKLYDLQIFGTTSPAISYFSRISIGTSDNSELLNVNGNINANGIIAGTKIKGVYYGLSDNVNYYLDPSNTGTSLKVAGKIESKEIQVVDINTNYIKSDEIKTGNLNVEVNNVADYVFDKNYKLLSLKDVEEYVKMNKHLPEIPNASELETNGMNVAEMNNLLLKKIEELTLYIIQLNKENEEIKNQLERLTNKQQQ